EASLGRPIALCIPRDESALTAAETAQNGMAELPVRTPAMVAVDHLARMLLGGIYATGGIQRRGVFSRLFATMSLIDRLHGQAERPPTAVQPSLMGEQRPAAAGVGVNPELFQDLKRRVQERLLRNIDVTKLEEAGYAPLLSEITAVINSLIEEDHLLITEADRARLVEVTTNDMLGLGPLEPLLQDNEISDILVNGYNQVWIERRGKLYKTAVRFQDDPHLMSVINRIVSRIGRRIDEASPMVDARLPDGSRVHAIIPPLAIDGPGLCIRRFGGHAYRMGDLITNGTLTRDMAEFMRLAILTRLNILVSGGTGSGKTTLLNCLSSYLPENQRIITIEDAA